MQRPTFKKSSCYLAMLASHSFLLAAPLTANAQSLEEVIVTAERRAESLQQTPMSVTAFTGDMVSQGGITGIEDIAIQTPNFKLTTFNISEPQLYIRGIGTTNDSVGSDPAVAVFIDDVYVGRPSATSTDLYDLERIEVLRGPQGTLYGRNSAGGAVNIFSKKPQQEFEAKTGLTIGNEALVNFRGYINGPISDTVSGKLTVNLRKRDGFAENVTTGQELEDDDTKSVRGQLLFTPSDSVEVLIGLDYSDIDTSGSNRHLTNLDVDPRPPVFTDPAVAANAVFGNDPRKSSHNEIQTSEKELFGLLARVDVDMDWATLTSISSYRQSESAWFQALVPTLSTQDGGFQLFEVDDGAEQEADQISQEFRLASETDRLKWVAGLYYFKENVEKTERFFTYWDPITPAPLFLNSPGDVSFIQDATTESTAVFGQVTASLTDTLAVTLGARYTNDDKEIDNTAVSNIPAAPAGFFGIPLGFAGAPYSVSGDESWSDTTLRATLDWNITDSHMLYVTYSEGFKSGAFLGTQSSSLIAQTPIQPETSTNIEFGARTQWFDDRVRFNITYFDLDYEDLQTFSLIDFVLVANNASAEVSGIEADFAVAISEMFSITGSFSTLDGEFVDGANTGNDLPRAPETSWSLAPRLSVPLNGGASLDVGVTASYTDEYHFELSNDARGLEGDVTVVDASAKYSSADENWDVTLWGKNLSDELYSVHHINGSLGGATRIYAPPRTFGVSVNYYWN
ncbi:MAG: TonB-dependent receptor [Pseudomonadales bacterium]